MTTSSAPFTPPHCPRAGCAFHTSSDGWRWIRYGFFTRQCSPRRVQRYRCAHCGHTFSTQSFSTSYWLKRPELLPALAHRGIACSGLRQMAREMRCNFNTLMNLVGRLGRHGTLWMEAHRPRGPLEEELVIDGFESFAYSQYHPLHLNLVVGARSHYVYACTHTLLRRKGRMTVAQKHQRARLEAEDGRPDPRGIEQGMLAALRLAVPVPQGLVVRSDEHPAYPRALRRLEGYAIVHQRTSSRVARTPRNPLFPVNRADLLLRHNLANHKRETIAFSKRHQAVVERAAWAIAWMCFCKPFSERHGGPTPAMRAGIVQRRLAVEDLLQRRLFPGRVGLPEPLVGYYRREVRTPRLAHETKHRNKIAW